MDIIIWLFLPFVILQGAIGLLKLAIPTGLTYLFAVKLGEAVTKRQRDAAVLLGLLTVGCGYIGWRVVMGDMREPPSPQSWTVTAQVPWQA